MTARKAYFSAILGLAVFTATLVMADLPEDPIVDTPEAMSWPMLPGESLNQLAALFYPKNKAMQKRFVAKTLELSREINPALAADAVFKLPTTLIVPDLKALSKSSAAFKARRAGKAKFPKLHMSYQIADAEKLLLTPEMQSDFEDLTKRNLTLKDELKRLNEKLVKLQQTLSEMLEKARNTLGKAEVSGKAKVQPQSEAKLETKPLQTAQGTKLIKPAAPKVVAPVQAIPAPVTAAVLSPAPVAEPPKPDHFASAVVPVPAADTPKPEVEKPATPAPVSPVPVVPATNDQPALPAAPKSSVNKIEEYLLDSDFVGLALQLGMIVFGLVLAFFAWRWIRKRIAIHIRKMTNEQMEAMHKNKFDPNNASIFHSSKPGAIDSPDLSMLYIEEFESVVEEARIFMSMDRSKEAISLLTQHIAEQPKSSLHPWIYLLEVYRDLDMREEFIELAKRFHETFNVIAPQWHSDTQVGMVIAESLEEFPHIVSQLEAIWATPKAKPYLESLIADNREGERSGFSFDVIKEIMMLMGMLDMRDKQLTF